ncbi:ATP-grasp fold amidoligase family protein [Clostridium botulinum]|uniref:ATP-grasp fold amidoligase family protein n=1 Tax=Clostridium botulinum TaxID=1491 RepID=UPI00217DCBE7|nr:ATP-grasp fold amidoligase family protein [Clostridium botulinum]
MRKKIKKLINNPSIILLHLLNLDCFKMLSDEKYIKAKYKLYMKRKLNLKNPKTFNEKLQWLKLYNRNSLHTKLVDKYEVREHISKIVGKEYLIPLIGVWNNFEEIDFSKLPNQFVLKCTHDSGGVVICKDKNKLDIEMTRKKINKSLKRNFYYVGREWPYKNIKAKIICEKLIKTEDGKLPSDYKFHCFNGEVDNVMVCTERDTGNPKFFFFDSKWNLLRYNVAGINASKDFTLPEPKKINEMFRIAKELSKGLQFVRVDLYCEEDKIYFGELTFFPQSGFDSNLLTTTDLLFGEKIELKNKRVI